MSFRLFFTMLRRESRGGRGRLLFVVASLAIGVAAVVGVAAFIDAIRQETSARSREILAADLSVTSRRDLPAELGDYFEDKPEVRRTDLIETATLVRGPQGASRMAEVVVVDGVYPFYGELTLSPLGPLDQKLDGESVVIARALADEFSLVQGDDLRIGKHSFRVSAIIEKAPQKFDFSTLLGPRIHLDQDGFRRAGLDGFGSRIKRRALFAMPNNPSAKELKSVIDDLRDAIPDASYLQFQSHWKAQPTLRRALERVESFLGLVALMSLLLGGVGVAQVVRSWLTTRIGPIAVLRSLGFVPGQIALLYLGQVSILALIGSLVGALVGTALPVVLAGFLTEAFPDLSVSLWQPMAILRGLGFGVAIALLFALLPILAVWRVSPARALRQDAEPLAVPLWLRLALALTLAVGVFVSAWWQSGSMRNGLYFAVGFALVFLALAGAALVVGVIARKAARWPLGPHLRHGIAALGRPGAATRGAIVALGIGFFVVVAMTLIGSGFSRGLQDVLPEDAPTAFFVDVQRDQRAGLFEILEEEGARGVLSSPVVMARISKVDGRRIEELVAETGRDGRPRWVLTREQRLTYAESVGESNTLVEGELWSVPDVPEVSVEQRFAEDLGVKVGSTITFDVQGVPLTLRVTSLRTVEWESFNINFFLLVEPGVIDEAPGFHVAVARIDEAKEAVVQDRVAAVFPNVSVLRIREIVELVGGLISRLALAVQALGAFTVIAGLAILIGSIVASARERRREVALLKTLGVTRSGVRRLFAIEFALAGAVAGLLGGGSGALAAWLFLNRILEFDQPFAVGVFFVAILCGAAMTAIFGLLTSRGALAARPAEVLREVN